MSRSFSIEGRPVASRNEIVLVSARQESANSLQALGVALRRGRFFAATDDSSAAPVAIVNEALARRHFPNEDPIGQHVLWKLQSTSRRQRTFLRAAATRAGGLSASSAMCAIKA
jgi:hypothetical protein